MTVTTTAASVAYAGNGATVAFAVPFLFLMPGHLVVTRRAVDGTDTVLTLNSDYTVAGAAVVTGGTVTMIVAPATGQRLIIERNTSRLQDTRFPANLAFPSQALEAIADVGALRDQEQDVRLAAVVQRPPGETGTMALPATAQRAGRVMAFDSSGEAMPGPSATLLEAIVAAAAPLPLPAAVTVATRAAMTALLKAGLTDGAAVFCQGGLSATDGDGGLYRWVAASTTTALGKMVLAANEGGTGRWLAASLWRRDEARSVRDLGAVGDGSTDDTAAFQAALTIGGSWLVPQPPVRYLIGDLIAAQPVELYGVGGLSQIGIKTGTTNWLTIRANRVKVHHLEFINGGNCSGALFYVDSAVANREILDLSYMRADQLACEFLGDANSSFAYDEVYVERVTLTRHAGPAVVLRDGFAFLFFYDVTVDYVGTAAPNHDAFDIQNVEGVTLERCEVTGTAYVGATSASQTGLKVANASAVFVRETFIDNTGGNGAALTNCTFVHFDDLTISLCDGDGVILDDCQRVPSAKVYVIGRAGLANKTASKHGILMRNGTANVNLAGASTSFMTGDGVLTDHTAAACRGIVVVGIDTVSNTGWGVRTIGTTAGAAGVYGMINSDSNGAGDFSLANAGASGTGFEGLIGGLVSSGAIIDIGDRIIASGNGRLGIGGAAASTAKAHVFGNGSTNATQALRVANSSGTVLIDVFDGGKVLVPTTYALTTAIAANMVIAADGQLLRSTSSARYKRDIEVYPRGLADVLALRPVQFREASDLSANAPLHAGFLAEDVAAADLEEYVVRDGQGRPDALHYPHMVALLTAAVQELAARVAALEARP